MPSIKDKLALEEQNERLIRLWPEGMFFKAYERSAYLFVSQVRQYEAREEFFKGLGREAVHIAFPQTVLNTLGVDHKKATDGSEVIKVDAALDEQQYLLWRDAAKSAVAVMEPPPVTLAAEPPPKPELPPAPSVVGKTVVDRLREFNLASATPLDCLLLVSELQKMIRQDD